MGIGRRGRSCVADHDGMGRAALTWRRKRDATRRTRSSSQLRRVLLQATKRRPLGGGVPIMGRRALWTIAAGLAAAGSGWAQDRQTDLRSQAPGVITGGSGDTSVGGLPAARKGDTTDRGGTLEQGSPNVFINGKPAVTAGDGTSCGGVSVGGAPNVFINGKPVARAGDLTSGCK